MKYKQKCASLLLAAILSFPQVSHATDFTMEPDANTAGVTYKQIGALVGMARIEGWRCDTVSSAYPHSFSDGWTLKCNHHRFHYEVNIIGSDFIVVPQ